MAQLAQIKIAGQTLAYWLTVYGVDLALALVILVVGWMVAGLVTGLVGRLLARTRLEATLAGFMQSVVGALLRVVVVIAVLEQLGVETLSLVAVVGAASLAVGLAMKNQLASLAAGVMIVVFAPFRVGDFIEAGGSSGTVEELNLLYTRLATVDGFPILLPNHQVFAGKVTNFSRAQRRRVELKVGVGYGDDLGQAREVVRRVMAADARVLPEPAPWVGVTDLGDSAVELTARCWTAPADLWQTACDLRERIKMALDQAGVSIPFPQREINVLPTPAPRD